MSAVLIFRCSRQARIRLQSLPVFRLATADGTTFSKPRADGARAGGGRRHAGCCGPWRSCGHPPRGRGAGFGGEDRSSVDLAVQVSADPGQRFAVVEHAFAIQVGIAGNALKFGDGFRGRGVAHHPMQHTVGRTHEHVGKSPGKRNDDLHACNGLLPLYPSACAMRFGVSPASRTYVDGSPVRPRTSSQIFTPAPALAPRETAEWRIRCWNRRDAFFRGGRRADAADRGATPRHRVVGGGAVLRPARGAGLAGLARARAAGAAAARASGRAFRGPAVTVVGRCAGAFVRAGVVVGRARIVRAASGASIAGIVHVGAACRRARRAVVRRGAIGRAAGKAWRHVDAGGAAAANHRHAGNNAGIVRHIAVRAVRRARARFPLARRGCRGAGRAACARRASREPRAQGGGGTVGVGQGIAQSARSPCREAHAHMGLLAAPLLLADALRGDGCKW